MADLPSLLLASLQPQTRKAAEQGLITFSNQPGSLQTLVAFILQDTQDKGARLAGSTLLKNAIKRRWCEVIAFSLYLPSGVLTVGQDQDEPPVSPEEKSAIRSALLPAMVALSRNASDKALLGQINASIAFIAENDFPADWPELVQSLASLLSPTDVVTNNSVLETAHSIFSIYRSAIRSDDLYTIINLVLEQFLPPFLALFRAAAAHLLAQTANNGDAQAAKTMSLLTSLFYDLTCQDLPPAIEDAHAEFFAPPNGIFIRLLAWSPANLLKSADDTDTEPSYPSRIKTNILEILELYINRFTELFDNTSGVDAYVQSVWTMLSATSGTSSTSTSEIKISDESRTPVSDEPLISQSLRFLATAIRSKTFQKLFTSPDTISHILLDVIIPNLSLRSFEIEQFEDDPGEWVRVDLAAPVLASATSEGSTRRQAASDVLRAFVGVSPDVATGICTQWIGKALALYSSNPAENWKAKDTAIYLMTAAATRGSTVQVCIYPFIL
jgi:exportin-2 (importin alpha re-exporter)